MHHLFKVYQLQLVVFKNEFGKIKRLVVNDKPLLYFTFLNIRGLLHER